MTRQKREKKCIASDRDIGKSDHTIVEDDIAILSTALPEGKLPEGKRGRASTFAGTTSTR
jgi:hypothetical protein